MLILGKRIADFPYSEEGWARLKKFFETAKERQIIYTLKTLGLPRPWTQDSQFNTWFFCNVFRRNDKVTAWILQNILHKYWDDKDLWKKILLARRLSRMESMQFLFDKGGFDDFEKARILLYALKENGLPIVTNAFVMGIPDPSLGSNKIDYMFNLMDFYENIGIEKFLEDCPTIEQTTRFLMRAPNMGGFLSYEVATDFTYSRYLQDAKDINTWANPGPGCRRGLNVILTGDANTGPRMTENDVLSCMRQIYALWQIEIANSFDAWVDEASYRAGLTDHRPQILMADFRRLTMREVEHWLCEFDKHERKGKNKRTYP